MAQHLPRQLHADRRCRSDLLGHRANHVVELLGRDHPTHDAVRERLLGVHDPPGQHHVADHTVAAHLVQDRHATGVGDDAVGQLRQAEARALGSDAHVAQQRPLERAAHHPALAGDQHRLVHLPQLLDATVAPSHQLVVAQLGLLRADRAHVTARREGLPLAAPDHDPHVGAPSQLGQDVEQREVHLVVERVVLVRVVVADGRDRAVQVQPESFGHRSPQGVDRRVSPQRISARGAPRRRTGNLPGPRPDRRG